MSKAQLDAQRSAYTTIRTYGETYISRRTPRQDTGIVGLPERPSWIAVATLNVSSRTSPGVWGAMRRSFKAFNYAVKWTATASMESPLGSASDSDELSQAWPLAVAVVCFQNLVSQGFWLWVR